MGCFWPILERSEKLVVPGAVFDSNEYYSLWPVFEFSH